MNPLLSLTDTGLPVEAMLPRLRDVMDQQRSAVLVAPPGSGKTTLVPLALADQSPDRVVVAQPRRVAARAAARRMAELSGTHLGDQIGYTVRGERCVSADTRVEVVTTGVLVRRMQRDPELPGVSTVVIDECHERHLDTDLALGFSVDVRANLRDDLRVLAMSATAQAEAIATLLGEAEVVSAEAALHPVTTVWSPPPRPVAGAHGLWVDPALLEHVASTTVTALAEYDGDVLVFLPGEREIASVAERLSTVPDVDVLRLHGRQTSRDQDAVLRPGRRRRVVVASAVAESSVTVAGVRIVVDAGLSRQSRIDHARGLGRLVTVPVSRAAAQQRAGRAGRQGPGTVLRCWSASQHDRLAAHDRPEVATADLTSFVLQLACWGGDIALLDSPDETGRQQAMSTLKSLGTVDEDGRVTARGKRIADIPAHPRLGRALLDGAGLVGAGRASDVVAALSESQPHPSTDDLTAHLRRRTHVEEAKRLRAALPAKWRDHPPGEMPDDLAAATVVGLAFGHRLARHAGGARYLMAGGTQAELAAGSGLMGSSWLAVAHADRQQGKAAARVRLAVPCDADTAVLAGASLTGTEREVGWRDGEVRAEERDMLGAIVLRRRRVEPAAGELGAALRQGVRTAGLELLDFTSHARALRQRLAFCHEVFGAPWPDVSPEALLARLDEWLGPDLDAVTSRAGLRSIDVAAALRRLLGWQESAVLDRMAPQRIRLPSGSHATVDYGDTQAPALAAKLQEFFGCTAGPTVADGRVAVVLHLLSPAGRPVAVTSDLATFWARGYRQVRSELRGRYPKHPWPDDPVAAQATARTKRG